MNIKIIKNIAQTLKIINKTAVTSIIAVFIFMNIFTCAAGTNNYNLRPLAYYDKQAKDAQLIKPGSPRKLRFDLPYPFQILDRSHRINLAQINGASYRALLAKEILYQNGIYGSLQPEMKERVIARVAGAAPIIVPFILKYMKEKHPKLEVLGAYLYGSYPFGPEGVKPNDIDLIIIVKGFQFGPLEAATIEAQDPNFTGLDRKPNYVSFSIVGEENFRWGKASEKVELNAGEAGAKLMRFIDGTVSMLSREKVVLWGCYLADNNYITMLELPKKVSELLNNAYQWLYVPDKKQAEHAASERLKTVISRLYAISVHLSQLDNRINVRPEAAAELRIRCEKGEDVLRETQRMYNELNDTFNEWWATQGPAHLRHAQDVYMVRTKSVKGTAAPATMPSPPEAGALTADITAPYGLDLETAQPLFGKYADPTSGTRFRHELSEKLSERSEPLSGSEFCEIAQLILIHFVDYLNEPAEVSYRTFRDRTIPGVIRLARGDYAKAAAILTEAIDRAADLRVSGNEDTVIRRLNAHFRQIASKNYFNGITRVRLRLIYALSGIVNEVINDGKVSAGADYNIECVVVQGDTASGWGMPESVDVTVITKNETDADLNVFRDSVLSKWMRSGAYIPSGHQIPIIFRRRLALANINPKDLAGNMRVLGSDRIRAMLTSRKKGQGIANMPWPQSKDSDRGLKAAQSEI